MMLRWARLLISVLALVAALAGGTAGAFAAKAGHSCVEMDASDCPDNHGDDGATFPNCAQFACGQCQTTLPFPEVSFSPAILTHLAALSPPDDLLLAGRSGPPDLRPPIA
jgi:hypothetical protein